MATRPIDRKRPRIGDIIEVCVPQKGFAYAHYINHHREPPGFGALLRILPGIYEARPTKVEDLAAEKELYFVFFPLGAACNRGFVKIVGHVPITAEQQKWPLFRACNENYHTGVKTWFLWDGRNSWKIGDLKPEHYDLSLEQTINLTELENRLESGWMPRDEV